VDATAAATTTAATMAQPARKPTTFAGDALKVAFGASSSQLFSILAAPVLTRTFAPEAFGIMAVYASLVGIASVVAALRYDQAILLPESDEEAANVLALSLAACVVTCGLLVLLVLCFRRQLLEAMHASQLGAYVWLIPAAVFISSDFQTPQIVLRAAFLLRFRKSRL